jgi:predicted metal-dependent hydrolase
MKTKWGSCSPAAGHSWLNSELARTPMRCIEYIVVHELAHLLECQHGDRFVALLDRVMPQWQQCRAELNQVPLGHEEW